MGSFSFTRAERSTNKANIVYGDPYKLLIPACYGGGCIKDHYRDYGQIRGKIELPDGEIFQEASYDIYELMAFWNPDRKYKNGFVKDYLRYDEFIPMMPENENTDYNREIGIVIACKDADMASLQYPLKLVSVKWKEGYENTDMISFYDPYQGFNKLSWKKYDSRFN